MIRKLGPRKCLKLADESVAQKWLWFGVILSRYFLDSGNNFAVTRDDLEDTKKQQENQIKELEREKDQLESSLVQRQESIFYLQQEVKTWFITAQNSFVDVRKPSRIWRKIYVFNIYRTRKKLRNPFWFLNALTWHCLVSYGPVME